MIDENIALDFFRFIYDRQVVSLLKEKNPNACRLTEDPILSRYKFCNVYRQKDKCTKYLQEVLDYESRLLDESPYYNSMSLSSKLFWIIFFRRFNIINFFDIFKTEKSEGLPTWDLKYIIWKLDKFKEHGAKLFNDAYTVCQIPYDKDFRPKDKHVQICLSMDAIFKQGLTRQLFVPAPNPVIVLQARAFFEKLQFKGHRIGPFLAYQIMQDLNYIEKIPAFKNFTFVGPGAEPALNWIYRYAPKVSKPSKEELCLDLTAKQPYFWRKLRKQTGKDWYKICQTEIDWGESLSVHNIQNCLCEFRKYTNLKAGKGRKRIYKG
jgi:hypothetical protein